ncbi:Transcription factor MYB119 [Camellia lanceoleosa]|nr:Transcription factor MYB119 [Camellia lanceoleosa]
MTIEMFWSSKNNHFSPLLIQNSMHNLGLLVPASVYGGFSSSGGAIGGYSSNFLGPSFPEKSFIDGLFHDSETLKWTYEIDPNMGLSEDAKSKERNCKGVAKRAKGGSSTTTLIKGQWIDEEDRKLLNLVTQHGVRKWAQIAKNMVGRAGKQCRERWHNHLRPDIKVDCLTGQASFSGKKDMDLMEMVASSH